MRTIVSIFLILTTTLLISQTKYSGIKVSVDVDPLFGKITVKLKSDFDSLNNCKVQIIDAKKNTVKTVDLPKAAKQIENNIIILDLLPGNYTCFVYNGKEELYKKEFFKDALLTEPQGKPVLHRKPD